MIPRTPFSTLRTLLKWALLLGLLSGCRAFPISLLVPNETLDALETSEYVENLDPDEMDSLMAERFGLDTSAAPKKPRGVHRLDFTPESGPHRAEKLNSAYHPATAGLHSGDLLLAKNGRPQSLGQTLTFKKFTYYTHMGILAREGGRFYVFESWPRLHLLAATDNFAARFRGGVQKVSFNEFLERYETIEVVRLPQRIFGADIGERLVAAAKESLDENIRYDPHHDPDDPAMSCSEYVSYLLEDKLGYTLALSRRQVTENTSMRRLLSSLGFRTDAYVVPEAYRELPHAQAIALLSHQPSRAAHLGKFYAYQALHEHFVANSSISSYLGIHPLRLVRYRTNVENFVNRAILYAETQGSENPEKLRRDLRAMVKLFFRRKDSLEPGP